MLIAVNYHYIAADVASESSHPYPAIYPTSPDALSSQLEELGRRFEFVSGAQLLAALEGAPLPERACVVTFDDGLRGQFDEGLPVLDRLGVPALFFVSPRPTLERRGLPVHKIHFVRANVAPERILEALGNELPADAAERAAATYRYDEPAAALVKWLLNFGLDGRRADAAIDRVFHGLVSDEPQWARETYLGRSEIRELAARGWLGSHGWSHRPLATLDPKAMAEDLARSQAGLAVLLGSADASVPFVSYPYGGANAVGPREAQAAQALGFRIGFTMERALNRSLEQPLLLARIDTNDAPGGKHPLLAENEGELHCLPGLESQRGLYGADTVARPEGAA